MQDPGVAVGACRRGREKNYSVPTDFRVFGVELALSYILFNGPGVHHQHGGTDFTIPLSYVYAWNRSLLPGSQKRLEVSISSLATTNFF